jgi:phenylalanyl-tRNA synthetase alpha subunit
MKDTINGTFEELTALLKIVKENISEVNDQTLASAYVLLVGYLEFIGEKLTNKLNTETKLKGAILYTDVNKALNIVKKEIDNRIKKVEKEKEKEKGKEKGKEKEIQINLSTVLISHKLRVTTYSVTYYTTLESHFIFGQNQARALMNTLWCSPPLETIINDITKNEGILKIPYTKEELVEMLSIIERIENEYNEINQSEPTKH